MLHFPLNSCLHHVLADLRTLRADDPKSPRKVQYEPLMSDRTPKTIGLDDAQNHARGGHGIFGEPAVSIRNMDGEIEMGPGGGGVGNQDIPKC